MQKCRELTRKYGTPADHRRDPHHLHQYRWLHQAVEPRPGLLRGRQADRRRRALRHLRLQRGDGREACSPRASRPRKTGHGHGHSGMGTTLSANALAMHCMRANLEQVMTQAAYDHMLPLAKRLADGFRGLIAKHDLKWSVTELGARSEFQFCAGVAAHRRRGRGGLPRRAADGPPPVPDQPRHPDHPVPQHDPVLPEHLGRGCGQADQPCSTRPSPSCWPFPARGSEPFSGGSCPLSLRERAGVRGSSTPRRLNHPHRLAPLPGGERRNAKARTPPCNSPTPRKPATSSPSTPRCA